VSAVVATRYAVKQRPLLATSMGSRGHKSLSFGLWLWLPNAWAALHRGRHARAFLHPSQPHLSCTSTCLKPKQVGKWGTSLVIVKVLFVHLRLPNDLLWNASTQVKQTILCCCYRCCFYRC